MNARSTPWRDLLSPPSSVVLHADDGVVLRGTDVDLRDGVLHTSGPAPRQLVLRWDLAVSGRFLGDAWERAYGDLEWRGIVPHRRMPWYVVVSDGAGAAAFGVRTGGAAVAHWQVDPAGVELHLDLRNGTAGVQLGDRGLPLPRVEVVVGDDPEEVARALCRTLCDEPLNPTEPVYGSNDWYWAYSDNSERTVLAEAELVSSVSTSANRPFVVIDDGWQKRGTRRTTGPWLPGDAFGDMMALAQRVRGEGARPGIWMRPLQTHEELPGVPRLPHTGALDPSTPEALEVVARDVGRLVGWGYELVKHDFSTYDVFGRYGFQMTDDLTGGQWHFADRTRTTAEVLRGFYSTVRQAAGEAYVLGCNTVGHLAAGLQHIHRTGDDTSGYDWARTRRMGVNALAFRAAQHDGFFSADADCVPLSPQVPWHLTRQWLDVVARSGTATFVSAHPEARGPQERAALREAFALAAVPREAARALDAQDTTIPTTFRDATGVVTTYDWWATG